jgi:uncharacterized membrane protein
MSSTIFGWSILITWALACFLLVGLVWITLPASLRRHYDPTSEEILRERFTDGELSAEEYQARLAVLREALRDGLSTGKVLR